MGNTFDSHNMIVTCDNILHKPAVIDEVLCKWIAYRPNSRNYVLANVECFTVYYVVQWLGTYIVPQYVFLPDLPFL